MFDRHDGQSLVSMKKILPFFFVLLAAPGWAAIGLTNCQNNNSAAALTIAVTGFVLTTPGDGVMVWGGVTSITATLSVADNGGGGSQTYTQIGSNSTTVASEGAAFLASNATSAVNGATITLTSTVSAPLSIVACEVSSVPTSGVLDGTAVASSNNGTLTNQTSGALTTTNTGTDLLVFCVELGSGGGTGLTAGSGYAIPSGAVNTGARGTACQTKTVAGIQTGVTTSVSWSSASGAAGLFFALQQAGSGGASPPSLMLLGVGL